MTFAAEDPVASGKGIQGPRRACANPARVGSFCRRRGLHAPRDGARSAGRRQWMGSRRHGPVHRRRGGPLAGRVITVGAGVRAAIPVSVAGTVSCLIDPAVLVGWVPYFPCGTPTLAPPAVRRAPRAALAPSCPIRHAASEYGRLIHSTGGCGERASCCEPYRVGGASAFLV